MLYFFFYPGALIGDVAGAAFHAIVHTELASRADGFVVIGRNSESSSQFFIEFAEVNELILVGGDFSLVVREQEFLISGVPQQRELALQHDAGDFGHLKIVAGSFAKFSAAIVFLDADNAAGAANQETFSGQGFHLGLVE